MRILCLHGMGGNARMFEAQTNPITWSLRQDGHEFVYVDGISPCEPLDGKPCKQHQGVMIANNNSQNASEPCTHLHI